MNALARALSAEALKLRGTLAMWMCLIAPAVVVGLYVLQITFRDIPARPNIDPATAWQGFAYSAFGLWAFLMLPLFVTLQSALLAGLEHGERQWKHLLALPLPRATHYFAKAIALLAMVAGATAALFLMIPLGAWVVSHTQPAYGIAGAPPWAMMAKLAAALFAASCLIAAMHTWFAIRWRSFTVAVSIGMTATVMGFLIAQSPRFGPWYPWSMPVQVLAGHGVLLERMVWMGLLGGLAVTLFGLWDFNRRDID